MTSKQFKKDMLPESSAWNFTLLVKPLQPPPAPLTALRYSLFSLLSLFWTPRPIHKVFRFRDKEHTVCTDAYFDLKSAIAGQRAGHREFLDRSVVPNDYEGKKKDISQSTLV